MQANFPLPPGSVLGLLGGGQLGRMFAQAAASMGYKVKVLEKGECPASEVSAYHIDAAYTDKKAIEELRQTTAAVTTEFENVPAEVLSALAADGACVTAPASHAVAIARIASMKRPSCKALRASPWHPTPRCCRPTTRTPWTHRFSRQF